MPVLRQQADDKRQRPNVSPMRNAAVRTKGMSRKRGSRSGVSARVANDVAVRMRNIQALWFAVHNDPRKTVNELSAEFYYAVGEVLEGRSLASLTLRNIDRERVLAHAEE